MKKLTSYLSVTFLVMLAVAGTVSAGPVTIPLSDFVIFSGGGWTTSSPGSGGDAGFETQIAGASLYIGNIGSNYDLSLGASDTQILGSVYAGGEVELAQYTAIGSDGNDTHFNLEEPLGVGSSSHALPLADPGQYSQQWERVVANGYPEPTPRNAATLNNQTKIWGTLDAKDWSISGTPTVGHTDNTLDPSYYTIGADANTFARISMPGTSFTHTVLADPPVVVNGSGVTTINPGHHGALSSSPGDPTILLTSAVVAGEKDYFFDSIDFSGKKVTLKIDLTSDAPVNIYTVGEMNFGGQNNELWVTNAAIASNPNAVDGYLQISHPNAQALAGLINWETRGTFTLGGGTGNTNSAYDDDDGNNDSDNWGSIWGGTVYSSLATGIGVDIKQHIDWYGALWAYDTIKLADHSKFTYVPLVPAISLEKFVSVDGGLTYHEADDPNGPIATIGNDIWFKFLVANTGSADLNNITLTDPNYDLSDCNIPILLSSGESFACIIGPTPALAGQQTNIATAAGDFDGQTVSANDPANYFGADISIDLEKSVSVDNQVTYEDADVAQGPTATVGGDVWFRFVVTNTSNVTLTDVNLTDPNVDLSGCTIPSTLAPSESFTCVVGPLSAQLGQWTNTATVTGDYNDVSVDATDSANYFGANLTIDIEKSVSVDGGTTYHDADGTPGPTAIVDANVFFKFVVTNTNNVPLTNVTLNDSVFDFNDVSIISSTGNAFVNLAGDIDFGDDLADGNSFEVVIGPVTAGSGLQANTATATGDYQGETASASDPANYYGANLSIDIEKSVSTDSNTGPWNDADASPGPETLEGSNVYFRFVVTNTSNVNLTNITLSDPDYDLSDCNIPDSLSPGEFFLCIIGPNTVELGQQTNTATTTGYYEGETASASDPANYFGGGPAIDVEKFVSVVGATGPFHNANDPNGPTATAGSDIWFRFVVTNIGNVTLTDVNLADPDYDLSSCTIPASLAPAEAFACVITATAVSGQQKNTATATGDFDGQTYSDDDPANYLGVAADLSIDVEKSVSVDKQVTFDNADVAPGSITAPNSPVYFKFQVTNNGTVDLNNITLTDPYYALSDCNIPDSLAPGEFFLCIIGPFNALAGQQTNTATATGDYDGQTASASDPANYFGADLSIDIEKLVKVFDGPIIWDEWMDADMAPGPEVIAGSQVKFKYIVTNTGNVALSNIILTDPDVDLTGCTVTDPLNPGDSFECIVGPFDVNLGQHTNTGTVSGEFEGITTNDFDSANFDTFYWAFTPGFWKNNTKNKGKASHDAWKYTEYTTDMTLGEVFDTNCLDDYSPKRGKNAKTFDEFTLLEALNFKGGEDIAGAMEILLRAAVASLLNASFHEEMDNEIGYGGVYPYTTAEVVALVNEALCSEDRMTMLELYEDLDYINNGIHYIDWSWPVPTGF